MKYRGVWSRFAAFSFLVGFILYLTSAVPAAAMSPGQRKLFQGKVLAFDESVGCAASGDLSGKNNEETVFNYFAATDRLGRVDGHENPHAKQQAAGIVGNFAIESGIDPKKQQYGGGPGRGIAQWSVDGRWANLLKFAEANGMDPLNLRTQLDYTWFELTGTPPTEGATGGSEAAAYNSLKSQTTPESAAQSFMDNFERPNSDPSVNHIDQRKARAVQAYSNFKDNAQSTVGNSGANTPDGEEPDCGSAGDCVGGAAEYCFPVEGKKSELRSFTSLPCTAGPSGCHHDGTPAFDLIVGPGDETTGRRVYAIHEGDVESVRNGYKGVDGCYSIMLKQTNSANASDDGWQYWYGHIRNPKVREGQHVKAGTQLAEVGQRACTGNGSQPHLHIDRGSPKGEPGGSDCCRDPGFIDLINELYEGLPNG